ncbi:MAG TPA: dihydroorotase [Firmicutes bacterium]|nr:dihydroorotase [Bacillota bacterium]HHY97827.1 dihydroorotase [Bacillota bacterium]
MKLLLKGGKVVDPRSGSDDIADIAIEDGKIIEVGHDLVMDGAETLDVAGLVIFPGFIDMHVHLREPGREDEETIETGSAAAVSGGFTSIACMPNTDPPLDCAPLIEFIKVRGSACGLANIFPIGAATRGMQGEELSEIGELFRAGAVALSDDGFPISSSKVVRRVLEYSRMFNMPFISHAEDNDLSSGGAMNEGALSIELGLRGIPAASEEIAVSRNLILAEMTGGRIHIAHVSTARSIELIREAKGRGVKVTCEVTPHHFTLTEEAVRDYDTNTKMNPPLRTEGDVAALRAAIADGTVDVIATDHAPHTLEEKEVEFDLAPFGIIGLETAVPLAVTELIHRGEISLVALGRLMSYAPARILGLENKGWIGPGADADITVVDLDREFTIDVSDFRSMSRNSPFQGRKVRGKVCYTIVGGRIVFPA